MPVITFREALRQALFEEMRRDDRIFIMGEDIVAYGGSYGVTRGLADEFGEKRVRDTPIAESVVVGCGIGAALGGLRPIVEIMTINFSFLAIDQIINNASKIRYMSGGQFAVPLVIRMASGGGAQLAAQHSHALDGWYAHVPGLKVACPATPYDAKGLLKSAIREDNPVIFIEHTALYGIRGEVPEGDYTVPFGKANVHRQGKDVTIVAYSGGVHQSARAADMLAEEGIEAEVIDLRTLRPLDIDTVIQSVKKTHRAVIMEDDWKTGGFAGEISSLIHEQAFDYLDAPVMRVCGKDVPMPYAKNLEHAALPQEEDIVQAVLSLV